MKEAGKDVSVEVGENDGSILTEVFHRGGFDHKVVITFVDFG